MTDVLTWAHASGALWRALIALAAAALLSLTMGFQVP